MFFNRWKGFLADGSLFTCNSLSPMNFNSSYMILYGDLLLFTGWNGSTVLGIGFEFLRAQFPNTPCMASYGI